MRHNRLRHRATESLKATSQSRKQVEILWNKGLLYGLSPRIFCLGVKSKMKDT